MNSSNSREEKWSLRTLRQLGERNRRSDTLCDSAIHETVLHSLMGFDDGGIPFDQGLHLRAPIVKEA